MKSDAKRQIAVLRLFRALVVQDDAPKVSPESLLALNERTIPHGFVVSPRAAAALGTTISHIDLIKLIGLSGLQANASFHKSWRVVEESPELSLRLQQLVHYMTTYGFEALGAYDETSVYIPREELQLPSLQDNLSLVVIDALTEQELLDRALRLGSGVALKEETLKDLLAILTYNELHHPQFLIDALTQRGNRELLVKLYDHYGLVPANPVEFLRFLVQKLTGEALLIKNDDLLKKIAASTSEAQAELPSLLKKAPRDLASIFLRFKPIFLAIKKVSPDRTFFNTLRKKAVKLHKPLPEDILNVVTARLKNRIPVLADLDSALRRASIFRKIRLAYALKYRTAPADGIVYRVRNGKGWATSFGFDQPLTAAAALQQVLDSIAGDLKHLKGKTIYIPPHVGYALPATEKAFTGNMPSGSYITVPEDMIVGIHWLNVGDQRIDLDLSTISAGGKVGWDADYRTSSRDVLFSGDMTTAPPPHGTSELFYIKRGSPDAKIMMVNYFNYHDTVPVPAVILVAHEKPKGGSFSRGGHSYTVNPNNIVATAEITVNRRQTVLGLLLNVDGQQRFYFAQSNIGNNITSSENDYVMNAREFYSTSMLNTISLRDVLVRAGANVVDVLPPSRDFIDLSPERLDRATLLDLLQH